MVFLVDFSFSSAVVRLELWMKLVWRNAVALSGSDPLL